MVPRASLRALLGANIRCQVVLRAVRQCESPPDAHCNDTGSINAALADDVSSSQEQYSHDGLFLAHALRVLSASRTKASLVSRVGLREFLPLMASKSNGCSAPQTMPSIHVAARMEHARALQPDVWSIFRQVQCP